MKLLFNLLLAILFSIDHGAAFDTVSVSVMEGDSVTLHTGVKTNQQEDIKWFFNKTCIAHISGDFSKICTDVQCNNDTERFRDRLKLDNQTGSLTITNTTNTDSGEYKLQIFSSRDSEKIFSVSVHGAAERDEVTRKEGECVTFDPGVIKNPNDVMKWYFNDVLIAQITGDQSQICTDDQCKERFRDRLKLDNQTGSLNITNINTTDSGLYKLQMMIINSSFCITRVKRFSLTVTDSCLSSGEIAGICVGAGVGACVGAGVGAVVGVLLVAAAAGIIYHRHRIYTPPAAQNEGDDDNNPPPDQNDTEEN